MRIGFHVDGDHLSGAGHVGRCVPIAQAFARAGHEAVFLGVFEGLSAQMLQAAGTVPQPSDSAVDAAVVDSYRLGAGDLERMGGRMPLLTPSDVSDNAALALVLDYHFGVEPREGALAGPEYAPIDPAFARLAPPAGDAVRRVLVTMGASERGVAARVLLAPAAGNVFADAAVVVADGTRPLLELAEGADVALAGAGITAYELAAAGIPTVLVALADNQRRVVDGAAATGVALTSEADPVAVVRALRRLADTAERGRISAAARGAVDGRGAERVAAAALDAWATEVPSSRS